MTREALPHRQLLSPCRVSPWPRGGGGPEAEAEATEEIEVVVIVFVVVASSRSLLSTPSGDSNIL